MHHDVRASIYAHICFVCGQSVPDCEGIVHWHLGILTHQGDCDQAVDQELRVYDRSRRGRWRPRAAVLRRLRALRALRQALVEMECRA